MLDVLAVLGVLDLVVVAVVVMRHARWHESPSAATNWLVGKSLRLYGDLCQATKWLVTRSGSPTLFPWQ
ncbi:hypothetical protein RB200_10800 [Streptomyces sp. PmtG]